MSSDKEETQLETQQSEAQVDDKIGDTTDLVEMEDDEPAVPPEQKERERKEPVELVREQGRSLLPFARVQKIIKADKEIPAVAKEAAFLISFATEEFIKHLCQAAHHVADRDKRLTVYHRDIASVVRRVDEFLFLEEIIAWISIDSEPKRPKPKPSGTALKPSGPTLLDHFVSNTGDQDGDEDIVMNADGTMDQAVVWEE